MPSITRRPYLGPEQRAGVEAQVLAATERLLADGSTFTELGIQRIAAEAGVARSTFYVHFRDKTDLVVRLAGTMVQTAFDLVRSWRPEQGVAGLEDVLLRVIRHYRDRAHVLRAVNEVSAYDPAVQSLWNAELDRFVEFGVGLLTELQVAGRIPADLDPLTVSQVIVWGGYRVISNQVMTDDPGRDVAVARELARTQWYGAFVRPGT
ncbi:TetR/AcrR family transcriptional regulator [Micromonospora sp. NPDC049523]|uniref:TetR/AcrR family transcriptional regulator n=1 Tax=Micromonospora sp. NPDC049523 TaxID=3155921 RepID=UPI00344429B2